MRLLTRHTHILDVVDRSMNTDPVTTLTCQPLPTEKYWCVCVTPAHVSEECTVRFLCNDFIMCIHYNSLNMLLLIAYFSNYHANGKSDWFCPAQAHQTILRGGGGGEGEREEG